MKLHVICHDFRPEATTVDSYSWGQFSEVREHLVDQSLPRVLLPSDERYLRIAQLVLGANHSDTEFVVRAGLDDIHKGEYDVHKHQATLYGMQHPSQRYPGADGESFSMLGARVARVLNDEFATARRNTLLVVASKNVGRVIRSLVDPVHFNFAEGLDKPLASNVAHAWDMSELLPERPVHPA